jgi:hypothetical protein
MLSRTDSPVCKDEKHTTGARDQIEESREIAFSALCKVANRAGSIA